VSKLFDVTVSKSDKICRRDSQGFYQTSEYGYTLTEKDVPAENVTERSLELRLKATRYICQSEVLENRKEAAQALEEIRVLEQHLKTWREKNGDSRDGDKEADTSRVVAKETV
jgi:flagellar motility protein MotE (MotC chaperone)